MQQCRRYDVLPTLRRRFEFAAALQEFGHRLYAVNRAAELVLDVAYHRGCRGAGQRAGGLVGEEDLRRAARIVTDDARRFVDRGGDNAGDLRLPLEGGF